MATRATPARITVKQRIQSLRPLQQYLRAEFGKCIEEYMRLLGFPTVNNAFLKIGIGNGRSRQP